MKFTSKWNSLFVAAVIFAGTIAVVLPASAQNVGDPIAGRKFAQEQCAQCHAVLPEERVSPRFNIASFGRIANTPGMTAQALSIWMTTSHPTMPNLVLEAQDRQNVVAYIASLKDQ